jgi:hypothetical protein
LGYVNIGPGRPEELDPVKAPLVRKAFELYGSGRYNLDSWLEEMNRLGLRNQKENRMSRNDLSRMLNDPFYIGLIRLRQTSEMFSGTHQPVLHQDLIRL